jgi:excisionase family DNA binding protein
MRNQPERRPLLTEQQVAERLNIPVQSLRNSRIGRGELASLPFYKVGRNVRYSEHDLDKFLERGRREPAA